MPDSPLPQNNGASDVPAPLQLSALKIAWLTELGLDRRMLARYRAPAPAAPSTASAATAALDQLASIGRVSGKQAQPARQGRERVPSPSRVVSAQPTASPPKVMHAATAEPPATPSGGPLPADLHALHAHAVACQACGLHQQRDQLVFGAGDTDQPEWMIVGEAPAQADDRSGQPFQGQAGQLLHAMLVAIGVHPASLALGAGVQPTPAWSRPVTAYFTTLVKCRPLGNHSPDAEHIAACLPIMQAQIEAIRPRRILALGRVAAQSLLKTDADLDALRGQVHSIATRDGQQIPLVVTWHPASLLVQPQNKPLAWEDLALALNL